MEGAAGICGYALDIGTGDAGSEEKLGAGLLPGPEKTRVAPSASRREVNDGSASCKRFDVEDLCETGLSAAEVDVLGARMGEGQSVTLENLGAFPSVSYTHLRA